ncbi:hypothetical protein H6P81_002807 [Aristolochia fimbriata]|uniref:Uncharacterized protein n=1 Tax=Aristolochia fimbriata TaxID=158543 RepID=A0AAV7FCH4_ARIFI|nr:hypothetical protein H6P81_002807 [Aristolochia fimbriata]
MPNRVYTNKESIAHSVCETRYEPTRGNAPGPYIDRKKSLIIYLIQVNTHISRTNPSNNTEVVETLRLLQVATIRKHLVLFAQNQDAPIFVFWGILTRPYNSELRYEPTRGNAPGPYIDRKKSLIIYLIQKIILKSLIFYAYLICMERKAPDGEDFFEAGIGPYANDV